MNARRVENQTRILHHSKQSVHPKPTLCEWLSTLFCLVLYSIAHQKDEHNTHKHVVFFFRKDICHFPPKPSRFFVFVVFGEIVRENEITSEPPTWQPKTTRE